MSFWSTRLGPALGRSFQRNVDRLTDRLGGRARRQVVVLLGLVLALNSADNSAIGAVSPQLEPALHIGAAEIGLLVTVSSLVGALAALPFGVLTDKMRRVPLLSITIVVWGIAEWASAFSSSYGMLLLTRLAVGAITAVAVPAVASLTGDFFAAGERGRIYGYITTGEIVGAGIGLGLASLVSGLLGWRAALTLLALPSLLLAWVLWTTIPEPARGGQSRLEPGADEFVSADAVAEIDEMPASGDEEQPRSDDMVLRKIQERGVEPDEEIVMAADPTGMTTREVVRYVLRVRTNVAIIIASSLGYLFLAGLRTFAVLYARGHFGVGQGLATLLLGIVGVGAVLGLLISGRLADRLIRRGLISARITVAAVAYLAASVLLLTGLVSRSLAVSLPLLALGAAALAAPNPPLDAAQLDIMPAQLWGRAQGVRTALRNTLEAFGPLFFGLVAALFGAGAATSSHLSPAEVARQGHGLEAAFLLMLVPLGAAGVYLFVKRRYYAVDVASAGASERLGKEHTRGVA